MALALLILAESFIRDFENLFHEYLRDTLRINGYAVEYEHFFKCHNFVNWDVNDLVVVKW